MHNTVKNLIDIENNIKVYLNKLNINNNPKIVAVSKTFKIDNVLHLIEHGHVDYGENKVQEAIEKWTEIKKTNSKLKLHMIGKLQTNKVKFAVQIFDYIHSVDSEKLAKKIADEQNKINSVCEFLREIRLGRLAPAIRRHRLTFSKISKLTDLEWREIGISKFGLCHITQQITALDACRARDRHGRAIWIPLRW